MKNIFSLAALLLLTNCASMDLEECQTSNWQELGRSDAESRHVNLYNRYAEGCKEYGVIPGLAQYEAGFRKGLQELCTFQNGYLIGNEGTQQLPRICPKENQEKFVQGYIEGQRNNNHKKQMEKQNQLLEKALDVKSKDKIKSCDSNYQCGTNGICVLGECHN